MMNTSDAKGPYESFVEIAEELVLELRATMESNPPDSPEHHNAKVLLDVAALWLDRGQRRVLDGAYDSSLTGAMRDVSFGKMQSKVNDLERLLGQIKRLPPPYPPLS